MVTMDSTVVDDAAWFGETQRYRVSLVGRGHAPFAEIFLALQHQPPGAVVPVTNAAQIGHQAVAIGNREAPPFQDALQIFPHLGATIKRTTARPAAFIE